MHPSSKRAAAQLTGESPPSQRTRRSYLPPSLLPGPLLPSSYCPNMIQQPPRREYNTVQPGFTLEELEEMDDDPEAAAEAAEEEAEDWRVYCQSQLGRLPRSRSYESPYSTQEPPVSTPRYQATPSQKVARAPRARAPRARPITRSTLASRSPPRARSRSLSEYEDELIPPPPRLRFESEIGDIERRSGGVFITYNCNVVIRYLKDSPFTETLVGMSLRLYDLWRLQVFPICERELRRREQGIRIELQPIEAKVNTQYAGVRDVKFNVIEVEVAAQWQKVDTQLVSWAKHTDRSGAIKALTVDLSIVYAPATNQPAASRSRVSSRPSMLDQLRGEVLTPLQISERSLTPCVSPAGDAIGLRVELTRYWRCKKRCPNVNWCYVLGQVDVKLMDEDLREWVTGIQQGIANIQNPPHRLATRLAERAAKGGNNSRRARQSASGESSTSTPGVVNHFHVGSTSLVPDQQTPTLASRLTLLSSPILPIRRLHGINRAKDLEEFFTYQKQSVSGDLDWEADFEAAHEIVRDLRWDLELLRDKSDGADPIKELVKAGVKSGVARRLWKDSKKWANERRTQLEGSFQDVDN